MRVFLFSFLLVTVLSVVPSCLSNLQCSTYCCVNEVCVEKDECYSNTEAAYWILGSLTTLALIVVGTHLVYEIYRSRKNIKKKMEEIQRAEQEGEGEGEAAQIEVEKKEEERRDSRRPAGSVNN